jgi:hypothetical protein
MTFANTVIHVNRATMRADLPPPIRDPNRPHTYVEHLVSRSSNLNPFNTTPLATLLERPVPIVLSLLTQSIIWRKIRPFSSV